jgi:cytochrome c oxidase subunit 3
MSADSIDKGTSYYRIHPLKFTMYLFLSVVLMLFGAFTSAYIVRRAEGNWEIFQLPEVFQWSVYLVVASSIFMQLAYFAAKRNYLTQLRIFLWLTLILGVGFLFNQYNGWLAMVEQGVYYVGNPSGSFVYIISAMHAVHVLGGVAFLISSLYAAHRFRIHANSLLKLNLCTTFWHFMGGLWVYLFVFLYILR